jgi:hypothetical protein
MNVEFNKQSYIGKFVFLEKVDNTQSTYGNGEYLILRESPSNLYGITLVAGYGSHDLKCLPLIGKEAYEVIRVSKDNKFLKKLADDIINFHGEKYKIPKHWMDSVYDGAYRNALLIYEILGEEVPAVSNIVYYEQPPIKEEINIVKIEKTVVLSDVMTSLIDKVDSCHRERVRNIVNRIFYEIANLK